MNHQVYLEPILYWYKRSKLSGFVSLKEMSLYFTAVVMLHTQNINVTSTLGAHW